LNILNKNINTYNNNTGRQDDRVTNNTYTNTRRHFSANRVSDARQSYGNDARNSYGNGANHEYTNQTNEQTPQILQKKPVHKTIHHKYEALKLN